MIFFSKKIEFPVIEKSELRNNIYASIDKGYFLVYISYLYLVYTYLTLFFFLIYTNNFISH